MPIIAPGAKVLVTGANGFIPAWVISALLDAGFAVRGTVRAEAKGVHLKEVFKAHGDRFEIRLVRDIVEDGAYDEAVKGVDAVAHLASPVPLAAAADPQEIIDPAVKGTTGILKSILKNGSGIKRVVVLSSTTAISEIGNDKIFDEQDWNTQSLAEVAAKGAGAGFHIYRASKTLAERAAWEIYNENKDEISWDLTILNPPWVFGPMIHEVPHVDALNLSSLNLHRAVLVEGAYSAEALGTEGSGWVDVRDLALAHVRTFTREKAGGERIIVSAGTFVWQDFVDAAHALSPPPALGHRLVTGVPGAGKTAKPPARFDASKGAQILGLEYRGAEEMMRDVLEDYQKRGW